MKNTVQKSRNKQDKSTKVRTTAVRALTGSALHHAKGGGGGVTPTSNAVDPIC